MDIDTSDSNLDPPNTLSVLGPKPNPINTPELLDEILLHLGRGDWCTLSFVSHFFRNVARRRLMDALTIQRSSIDVCRKYITSLIDLNTTPLIRQATVDVSVSTWETGYYLRRACSATTTRALTILATSHAVSWGDLSTTLMTILLHNLPNITVLCIRPLHPFLQIALLEGYSAKLVMLKIHSSIGEASSWGTVNLPCLETLEIVEDCSDMQGSLVTHFTKYVCAPKLRNASLVAATEMPVFGVIEFLIAFGELLEVVKVIGTIVPYGRDRTIFPPLPNVRIASLELVLATEFLTRTPGGVVRWPKLETLILESDWLTIETEFFREVNWVGLKECLLILTPPPTIICGYRASVPVLGETFRRMFIDKIAKGTGGWDISSVFTVGQIKCDPMYQTIVE